MNSWNRSYRPKKIEHLHLDAVRKQLLELVSVGKIPQTLLFAGPKGTGKTSASRIIASILNDPQNEKAVKTLYSNRDNSDRDDHGRDNSSKKILETDSLTELQQKILSGTSFVVQEIDAASNRGIDDIRALKERVMLPPQEGNVAVYILDEAHMLTSEAFNALLKLLEEPPSHAVFILATTELHKIPATIASRCHVIHFHKASQSEIITALERILVAEKITYQEIALNDIASRADGSFRDAIKMTQVVAQTGEVSSKRVGQLALGSLQSEIEIIIQALLAKDAAGVVSQFENLRSFGVDQEYFYKSLIEYLHHCLLQNLSLTDGESKVKQPVVEFLLKELNLPSLRQNSPLPHLPLELKLLEIIARSAKTKNPGSGSGLVSGSAPRSGSHTNTDTDARSGLDGSSELTANSGLVTNSKNADRVVAVGNQEIICQKWKEFVEIIATQNQSIAAILASATPLSIGSGQVMAQVFYTFHQEQLMQQKIYDLISLVAEQMAGGRIEFDFQLNKNLVATHQSSAPQTESLTTIVSDILM